MAASVICIGRHWTIESPY